MTSQYAFVCLIAPKIWWIYYAQTGL